MASESRLPEKLLSELRHTIARRGVVLNGTNHADSFKVRPSESPPGLSSIVNKSLPYKPLVVAVDIYGTLLASAQGEVGMVGAWDGSSLTSGHAYPHDMSSRLRSIVADDHAEQRAKGIPWPEVDAPSVFARALGLGREDGARACVEWECDTNPCMAMPGALAFMSACSAIGIPLGIVSNAQFYTPLFIEEAFGMRLLASDDESKPSLGIDPDLVLWSYETGRAKPDPWMYDELARRVACRGIAADRILFIGNDSLNDCAAAGEAGLMSALFCGDNRSCKPRSGDTRVENSPPSTLVFSWEELRRLVCT